MSDTTLIQQLDEILEDEGLHNRYAELIGAARHVLEQQAAQTTELQDLLIRNGFVRCDIAACNCGSWHARYGLPERMQEIKSALSEAGHELCNANGNLVLRALQELIAERDQQAAQIEALRADAERQATPDQILELCEALETRRILNEIKKVATLHPADDMPTPFQSAWQTCCEEIFYRATGEQWHMDEDARKFARAANDSDIDAALRQEQPT